jgi:AcrR family transcriptional regulator
VAKKSDRIGNRRHQQGIESRQRILEAAFEIAAERGYDGTTLSEVTKRAGIPPSSVYWQFENKDELLAEVVEENYREWRDTRATLIYERSSTNLSENVEFVMQHVLQGALIQPAFQRLGLMLSLERRVTELAARKRFRQIRDETRDLLTDWWERSLPEILGENRHSLASEMANVIIAISDGLLVMTQIDEGIDIDGPIRLITLGFQTALTQLVAQNEQGASNPEITAVPLA